MQFYLQHPQDDDAPVCSGSQWAAVVLLILVVTGVMVWNMRPDPIVYTHVCNRYDVEEDPEYYETMERQPRRRADEDLQAVGVKYI